MLDRALVEEIKEKLLAEKKKLLTEAMRTLSGLHSTPEFHSDFADRSSVDMEQDFALLLREREKKYIQKIDEALERIELGVFGKCVTCGGEIGIKRLKARNTVTLCINCKEEEERLERLRRQPEE